MNQHITLFGLLEKLRPFFADYILSKQQRLATDCISNMEDTIERDHLIAFLDAAREQRAVFYASLTSFDRGILATIVDRRIIETLQSVHAVFQEHGYTLLPEFTQLRHWREMSGSELVHALPVLPKAKNREKRHGRPKVTGNS